MLAKRTNIILRKIFAFINISAHLAHISLFALRLGLGLYIFVIVIIRHRGLIAHNACFGYRTDKHSVRIEVNIILNFKRKCASSTEEAAAMALKSGCDLNCGDVYSKLIDAYEEDLITEEDITNAAEHLYTIRFLLGEFEQNHPYKDLPYDLLDCKKHRELNLKTAEESIVLLKNENNALPLTDKP